MLDVSWVRGLQIHYVRLLSHTKLREMISKSFFSLSDFQWTLRYQDVERFVVLFEDPMKLFFYKPEKANYWVCPVEGKRLVGYH